MEERRPRERELVLSPNEYAYILDSTKGHINCYVGPNKTSLAQTDELVVFNELSKRFDRVAEMAQAVQLFATAPAGWYLILKNPSRDERQPSAGMASPSADLDIGRKVVVHGPASFPLWPGQMARVIQGHRLRSNQYLVVQAYDMDAANTRLVEDESPWVQGEKRIVRGTHTSFYIPPTGVEVVADERGALVRDAVTLQRLEYCILIGENGTKAYVRGEAVVFPSPHQEFYAARGQRKFRAIELSDTTGLYLKVIAPYEDLDEESGEVRTFTEGEELFLTGSHRVYFPRHEHAIIRHGASERHHAVAIPRGQGRYVLDRRSGEVRLVAGPRMFLPDPRREVLVRRVLSLDEQALIVGRAQPRPRPEKDPAPVRQERPGAPPGEDPFGGPVRLTEGDHFSRGAFEAPRTITLSGDTGAAVRIDVATGYAVQLKTSAGQRRVVNGPASALLEYDETVEVLRLSRGTPKRAGDVLETAHLQLSANQVSDEVVVCTQDLVSARLKVKYRVNFEGDDPARWFMVDNYVQLLADHASSIIKAAARRYDIHTLRADVTDVVRRAVLGDKPDGGRRPGLAFVENAMRVYDIEVLDLAITDEQVDDMLHEAQFEAVSQSVRVSQRESLLSMQQRHEEIERTLAAERQRTELLRLALVEEKSQTEHAAAEAGEQRRRALIELERAREMRDADLSHEIRQKKLQAELAAHEAQLKRRQDLQSLELERLRAEVEGAVKQAEAYSPHLVSALHRLGDETMISALTENFSELAAVEGRGVLETARKFLDFVPQSLVPQLKSASNGTNGTAVIPSDEH